MRLVASQQSQFLPWLGYWSRVLKCDEFVTLLAVDYTDRDYQNRVSIGGAWASVPVGRNRGVFIQEVTIKDHRALKKIGRRIQNLYGSCDYYERLSPIVECLFVEEPTYLWELNRHLFEIVYHILGASCNVTYQIAPPKGDLTKTQRLYQPIEGLGDAYLAGSGTLSYVDREEFPIPLYQMVPEAEISSDSILQLIATEEDPSAFIRNSVKWVLLGGV